MDKLKKHLSILKNQAGMGLIGYSMFGVAAASALLVFQMERDRQNNLDKRKHESNVVIRQIEDVIHRVLGNRTACKNTFFPSSITYSGEKINSDYLKDQSNNNVMHVRSVNEDPLDPTQKFVDIEELFVQGPVVTTAANPEPSPMRPYDPAIDPPLEPFDKFVDGERDIIELIVIYNVDSGRVEGATNSTQVNTAGSKLIRKKYPLRITRDPITSQVVDCFSDKYGAEGADRDACLSNPGAVWNNGKCENVEEGRLDLLREKDCETKYNYFGSTFPASYDHDSNTCVWDSANCPEIKGFDATTGQVKCF